MRPITDTGPNPFLAAGMGELEVTDIFCGAGGSSLGLEFVPGMRVTQALNHWDLAVEAHNANFPHADHDVHDIEVIPPSRFRRTPILWASPECIHHAFCRGPKKTEDAEEGIRSRATFSDIVRFTEYHRYDVVIVENVIEARLWCDTPGHSEKCNCGSHYDEWFKSMLDLGYEGRIIYFNSQFALPTPQSRDRMYCFFWRRGLPKPNLDFMPPSWCTSCEQVVTGIQTWKPASKGSLRAQPGKFEWGRYGSQYLYSCPHCHETVAPAVMGAKTIIDWSLPTERIGDRKRPLASKTRTRIKNGLERLSTTRPVTIQVGGHLYERPGYARVWSVDDPLKSVTGTQYMGVVVPNMEHNTGRTEDEPIGAVTSGNRHMLVQVNRGLKDGKDNRSVSTPDEPTRTISGHGELALVSFRNHGDAKPVGVPAQTVVGGGLHHGLLVYNGVPGFVRDLEDAAGTITGRDKQSLLIPYYGQARSGKSANEPVGTVTGKDRYSLVISESDIDDCLFRMLQWPELLAAQKMDRHPDGSPYQLTARQKDKRGRYRELSNEKRVKMIGNAVSSPVATMLGHAAAEILR